MQTQQTGKYGEQLAAQYLESQGYTILATNWRCKQGEIDIIAQLNERLVFVEVRTRHATSTETAFASVDKNKQDKMQHTALTYLVEHELEDSPWRIDVIAIALHHYGTPLIEHAEDALGW